MIRFDRNEFSGAFGDIGTDLPLLVGMILASGIDSASVLIVYGLLQIVTAIAYGIPMPVQPLKAVATLVIAQKVTGDVIYGAGLAIGLTMLLLTVTGLIELLARIIPVCVVRGIQLGLGLQLSLLALTNYVPSGGVSGYLLATLAFIIAISLIGNRKYPPALFVIALGVLYAVMTSFSETGLLASIGFALPSLKVPSPGDIITGFLLLGLPQIPLSLGNSILATERIARDYFPSSSVTIRKIGFTYSLMNIVAPFFGGVPVCHGSGGLVGHYLFGARSGGSVVIYGLFFITVGCFFSAGFSSLIHVFPLPMLGVILLFEGMALIRLVGDMLPIRTHFAIAVLVGLLCVGLPYGYLAGLVVGTILLSLSERFKRDL